MPIRVPQDLQLIRRPAENQPIRNDIVECKIGMPPHRLPISQQLNMRRRMRPLQRHNINPHIPQPVQPILLNPLVYLRSNLPEPE
jgi:hypothetical protein